MSFSNVFLSWFLLCIIWCCSKCVYTAELEYSYVTCGSTIKLVNVKHNARLHSHDVKYGSGSGQHSVTGMNKADDHNSYWQVKGKLDKPCVRGSPIKCGQTLRLMHINTQRNLHSHFFQSPLSHNQEVSCFGEDGVGDQGDNWAVTCAGKYWERNQPVRIKHVSTEMYLHLTGDKFGRPISGQLEVCAYSSPTQSNYWKTSEGIYVKPNEEPAN